MVRPLRAQGSSFQFACLSSNLPFLGSKAQAGEPGQVDIGAFLDLGEGPFQSSGTEDSLRIQQKVCDQEPGQLGSGADVSVGSPRASFSSGGLMS